MFVFFTYRSLVLGSCWYCFTTQWYQGWYLCYFLLVSLIFPDGCCYSSRHICNQCRKKADIWLKLCLSPFIKKVMAFQKSCSIFSFIVFLTHWPEWSHATLLQRGWEIGGKELPWLTETNMDSSAVAGYIAALNKNWGSVIREGGAPQDCKWRQG